MPRRRPHLTFGTVLSHLGVIVAVSAVLGVLAAGLVIPIVGAVGYGANATARSMQNLPEELKAAPLAQRTRVLDRNGNPIATFYDENRVNVPLRQGLADHEAARSSRSRTTASTSTARSTSRAPCARS